MVHHTRYYRSRSQSLLSPITMTRHIAVASADLKDALFRLYQIAGCTVLHVISRGAEQEIVCEFSDENAITKAMEAA